MDFTACLVGGNEAKLGVLCSYVPEEIISAAGFHPVRISAHGNPIKGADACLHTNLCPYVRSVLDDVLDGSMDQFKGFIFVNSCDAMRRLYDALPTFAANTCSYMIDIPRSSDAAAITLCADKFRQFAQWLEDQYETHISEEALWDSIRVSNRTRALMQQMSSLSKLDHPPIEGSEVFTVMRDATRAIKPLFNLKLEAYVKELTQHTQDGSTASKDHRPRILVAGAPIDQVDQISLIEDVGGRVVATDLCIGDRHFDTHVKEQGDPYIALATRYLNRAPCSRQLGLAQRWGLLERLATEYRVEGVVYHILKFCDNYMWEFPLISAEFEKIGLPVIDIESEYTKGSFGQSRTRLQAFIEMLQE